MINYGVNLQERIDGIVGIKVDALEVKLHEASSKKAAGSTNRNLVIFGCSKRTWIDTIDRRQGVKRESNQVKI